jgi:Holliday junction resolvase RusA-like endonuclease
MDNKDIVVYHQNPNIDYLFGYFGNQPVLTKQDKFKPIEISQINENGTEEILNNFYVKNPDSASHEEFSNLIKHTALKAIENKEKIKKPQLVEVYLGITITEKRFKLVDVDNLAKCVLDCLTNIIYEDDSQVSNLIVNKSIHPMKIDSILIGITMLNENRKGLLGNIELFKKYNT